SRREVHRSAFTRHGIEASERRAQGWRHRREAHVSALGCHGYGGLPVAPRTVSGSPSRARPYNRRGGLTLGARVESPTAPAPGVGRRRVDAENRKKGIF